MRVPCAALASDVSVAGVSMAMTYRAQVVAVINHHGGQVTSLIPTLRQKPERAARDTRPGEAPAAIGTR